MAKISDDVKQLILINYPLSTDYVDNKENIINFLMEGYCTENEKEIFKKSESINILKQKSEEEQKIAQMRKSFKERLRRHYIKIHEQIYGIALESRSEKRLSNGSQLSLDSPNQISKKLFADGSRGE